jgi:hypothetical protein
MTFWKPMVVALVLGVAAAPGAATAQSPKPVEEAPFVVRPLAGVTLDAGGKHVAAYYVADGNACQLTVAVAEQSRDDAEIPALGSRIHTRVEGGRKARLEMASGPALEFACAPGAATLTARVLQRSASN